MIRFSRKIKSEILIRFFHKPSNYSPSFLCGTFPKTEISKLQNALSVVSENWKSEACTVGLWLDVGTRCENDKNNGVAHFLEHMYFKGTQSRDHLAIQKECLEKGAKLYASTSREMISISVDCFKNDLEWAIGLLKEVITAPKYCDVTMDKQKSVILQEMQNIENDYKTVVFDYLHATAYQGTPLGRSIFGTEENIKSFTSANLYAFMQSYFKAPKMTLVGVGDIDHGHFNKLADKYLSDVTCNYENGIDMRLPCRFTGSDIRDRDDALPLAHVAIAFQGPSASHADNVPLLVASSIIGSYDQTHGGTYYVANQLAAAAWDVQHLHSFHHFFTSYHDTSLWGIYFTVKGTELRYVGQHMIKSLIRTCTNVTDYEVSRAKNQLKAQILQSLGSGTDHVANQIGKEMLAYGRRMPVEELMSRIDMVTTDKVRQTALEYIYDKCPAVAAYGPIEALTDYNNIRSKTWWLRY